MKDGLRVWSTLLCAVLQAAVPALGYAGWLGRTTGAEFQVVKTPMVPAGWAFSIWSVIFAACLVYAFDQARPSRRQAPLLRRIGWPMALAMAVNAAWSVLAQLEYPLVLLLGVFLVGFGAALVAVLRLAAADAEPGDGWRVAPAVGLLAGWVSVAIFANLSVALADIGFGATPSRTGQALILLSCAGVVAGAVLAKTRGALAYGAAVAWALAALAVANLQREHEPWVAAAAMLWLAVLALVVLRARRAHP